MNTLQYYIVEILIILLIRVYAKSRSIVTKVQILMLLDLLPALTSYLTFSYLWIVMSQPLNPNLFYVIVSTFLSVILMTQDYREHIKLFTHPPITRIREEGRQR